MRRRETTSSVKSLPSSLRVSDECLGGRPPSPPPSPPSPASGAPLCRSAVVVDVAGRVFEFKSVSLYFPLDKRRRSRPLSLSAPASVRVTVCAAVRAKEGGRGGGILELGIRLLLLLRRRRRRRLRRRTQCRLNIPPIHSGSCSRKGKRRERGR